MLVPHTSPTTSDDNNDVGPKTKDSRCQMAKKKTKADNDHEIYMYSEHLANTDDYRSLSADIFYVDKTQYLVYKP